MVLLNWKRNISDKWEEENIRMHQSAQIHDRESLELSLWWPRVWSLIPAIELREQVCRCFVYPRGAAKKAQVLKLRLTILSIIETECIAGELLSRRRCLAGWMCRDEWKAKSAAGEQRSSRYKRVIRLQPCRGSAYHHVWENVIRYNSKRQKPALFSFIVLNKNYT